MEKELPALMDKVLPRNLKHEIALLMVKWTKEAIRDTEFG